MPKQDPTAILEQDHQRVRSMFAELKKQREVKMDGVVEELIQAVENHTKLEEEIFYPAFRDAVRGQDEERLYFESLEEHHIVDVVIGEVQKAGRQDGPALAAKVKVLRDLVTHHLEEEEQILFPLVRKVMGEDQLEDLAAHLTERKQAVEGAQQKGGQAQRGAAGGHGSVDLNAASAEELQQIEGIDQTRAEKLFQYRQQHGPFKSWDDVAQVEGIGGTLMSKLQEGASIGREAR